MTVEQTVARPTIAPPDTLRVVSDVAVVITHYRTPEDLTRCLQSVAAHGGERVSEVIVCDSHALPDHADAVSRTLPNARYVGFERNVGYAALVNAGVSSSQASYVLVLNADVEVAADAVELLAAHLDANPSVGVVAPRLNGSDGSLQHSTFRFYRPMTLLYRRTPLGRTAAGRRELERFLAHDEVSAALQRGAAIEVDWALGAALLLRRAAFQEVGPLHEPYFLYFEDVDQCLRCWQSGWRVHYLPTAQCRHAHARASAKSGVLGVFTNPLLRRHICSAARFFRRHGLRPGRSLPGRSTEQAKTALPGPVVIDLRR